MSRSGAEAAWQAVWMQRGWRARLLYPASLLYGLLARQRRARYARGELPVLRLSVPVIVVGNVVVGGAGKTPTVLALLDHLKAAGWRPGVVSRGHGRQGLGVLELGPDTSADIGGDEPTLIRRRAGVPVCVGRERSQAAQALLSAHPDVNLLVCDDGLQHLALGRNIAIAVFDDRGLGNGWLLPAGLLREPWPPSPGDAFAPQLLLRPPGLAPQLEPGPGMSAHSIGRRLADVALGIDGTTQALSSLCGAPVTAVAGVARPQAFFRMLRERGLQLERAIALPDHAEAAAFDVLPRSRAVTVVCTEKDAVKLFPRLAQWPPQERPRVWAVPLEVEIDPSFFAEVDRLLARFSPGARLSSTDGHQTA
jgi:tetraacyldisaccharide 4'-kinase